MHVLVYFDASEQWVAYDAAALLCKKFAAELDLLVTDGTIDPASWQKLTPAPVRVVRGSGPVTQRVAAACAQRRYDLVVAALADHRGLLRLLLGSRVGQLVHVAPATIWVARGHGRSINRIVVGLSGGPQTEQDVRLAVLLAKAFDARITLVHVVSQLPLVFVTWAEYQTSLHSGAGLAALAPAVAALGQAEKLVREAGVPVTVELRAGVVLDELLAVCAGGGVTPRADLLLVGAHQIPAGAGGSYVENLAEQITQTARVPTLVVHADSDWQAWESAQIRGVADEPHSASARS